MKYEIGDIWFYNQDQHNAALRDLQNGSLQDIRELFNYCKQNEIPFDWEDIISNSGANMIEGYQKTAEKQIKNISGFGVLRNGLAKELESSVNYIKSRINKILSNGKLDIEAIEFSKDGVSINGNYLKEKYTSYVETEKEKEFLDRIETLANDYNSILKDYNISEKIFTMLLLFDAPTCTAYENDSIFVSVRNKLK